MAADDPRWRALGGVAGPAIFIASWAVLGTNRPGYSPVDDQISRLAAVGASSRPAMTLGLAALGVGVLVGARPLGVGFGRRVGWLAASTALATLGVAALPLGSKIDGAHAAAAALSYGALAATPLVAAGMLAGQGRRVAAAASGAVGLASAAALLASVVVAERTGLWQRVGLSLGDGWLMAASVWLVAGRGQLPPVKAGSR